MLFSLKKFLIISLSFAEFADAYFETRDIMNYGGDSAVCQIISCQHLLSN